MRLVYIPAMFLDCLLFIQVSNNFYHCLLKSSLAFNYVLSNPILWLPKTHWKAILFFFLHQLKINTCENHVVIYHKKHQIELYNFFYFLIQGNGSRVEVKPLYYKPPHETRHENVWKCKRRMKWIVEITKMKWISCLHGKESLTNVGTSA